MTLRAPTLDLVVLPCAGASATMYLRWKRALPAWVRVVPVELPGRGARCKEPYVTDFTTLVNQLCQEFSSALQGNYVLMGHSMGALLAYGMACRQRALCRPLPRLLVVSASAAPTCRDPHRYADKQDDASLIADLRKQAGTPEDVFRHAEMLRMTLDTLAADYRVCASFRPLEAQAERHTERRAHAHLHAQAPTPALPLPIHAFGGRHDDIATQDIDQWCQATCTDFAIDWFDGGHFFIREQESAVLATLIRALTPYALGAGNAAPATA